VVAGPRYPSESNDPPAAHRAVYPCSPLHAAADPNAVVAQAADGAAPPDASTRPGPGTTADHDSSDPNTNRR
jgi:hypothetical protein